MYLVERILICSHGMGISSISILLNELLSLLQIAQNKQVQMIRLGTSGGIGIEGGNLIITSEIVNEKTFKSEWIYYSCGKEIRQSCQLNADIASKLKAIADAKKYPCIIGKTMTTEDYYEGQARLDGALCDYKYEDKENYLKELYKKGVRNFEMEGSILAGMCTRNEIPCAMLCVAYLNRLNEDTVAGKHSKEEIDSWMVKAIDVVVQYICEFIMKKN